MNPLLSVENLRIAFRLGGRLSVPVRGVSFAVPANARVALVGESGCGKSLTALALGGLVDRAEISGRLVGSPRIAYVFQNPMQSLDPVMRVGRQIDEARPRPPHAGRRTADDSRPTGRRTEDNGRPTRTTDSRRRTAGHHGLLSILNSQFSILNSPIPSPPTSQLLASVGLPAEAARKYPCELSGGQQQRVMIAMALAQEPDLLIADEPTTALDVTTQRDVLDLIARVADERKMSVLLITHNLGLVARYASFVHVMYAGEIVERGPVAEVLAHPRHPYTQGLLAAVPRLDAPRDAPLADIPGTVPPPWAWPTGCAFHPRCPRARLECARDGFTPCVQG